MAQKTKVSIDYATGWGGSATGWSNGTNEGVGQTFEAPCSNIKEIHVCSFKGTGISSDMVLEIYAVDGDNEPIGACLGTASIDYETLLTSYVIRRFVFDTPVQLTPGNRYCFVTYTYRAAVVYNNTGAPYADGHVITTSDGGSTWTHKTTNDLWFRILEQITEEPKVYYLNNTHLNASDSNAGTDPNYPWLTWQKALQETAANDICYVGSGPYSDEDIEIINPGFSKSEYVAFIADPINRVIIDPNRVSGEEGHAVFRLVDAPYVKLDGFTSMNYYEHGIWMGQPLSKGHLLQRLSFYNSQFATGTGIAFHDEQYYGCQDVEIYNVTVDNCYYGIWGGGGTVALNGIVKNCLLTNCNTGIYFGNGALNMTFDYIGFYGNTTNYSGGMSAPAHITTDNPGYLAPSSGDFSLAVGVDHIDAGIDVGLPYVNTAPDIGAWEYGMVVLEQEGFRFRDDDGSETTASWLANQDTNITRPKNVNTRFRVLVNVTDNPASKQFRLEYRKKGAGTWNKV